MPIGGGEREKKEWMGGWVVVVAIEKGIGEGYLGGGRNGGLVYCEYCRVERASGESLSAKVSGERNLVFFLGS